MVTMTQEKFDDMKTMSSKEFSKIASKMSLEDLRKIVQNTIKIEE